MPLNEDQLNHLKDFYLTNRYPNLQEKKSLGSLLRLAIMTVEHWFKLQLCSEPKSILKSLIQDCSKLLLLSSFSILSARKEPA